MPYWDPIGLNGSHPEPRASVPLWILMVLEQPLAVPSDAGALGGRESHGEACGDGT